MNIGGNTVTDTITNTARDAIDKVPMDNTTLMYCVLVVISFSEKRKKKAYHAINYLYVSSIIGFLEEICYWIALLSQKQKQKRAIKVVFHALLNNYIYNYINIYKYIKFGHFKLF